MLARTSTLHRHTPTLTATDPRGLPVRSVDYCRIAQDGPAESRVNRTAHDPAGRAIAHWDPRLFSDASAPANLASVYSLSSKVLSTTSVDAGWRVSLLGEADQLTHSWDGRGSQRRMEYDTLLRPQAVFEQAIDEEPFCSERYGYGGAAPAFAEHNQCGQLIRHDDPAGTQLFEEFGLTGALLEQTQHFSQALNSQDWPEDLLERNKLLEPGAGATTLSRFNPLGEMIEQTDAKGNRQFFSQTVGGQLRESHLQLNGQPTRQLLVSDLQYNAHGQTERETLGNGIVTTLAYRPEDGRLTRLQAWRKGGDALQDLNYRYDPVGNVLNIEDTAQPIRYFANQRIDPISRYRYDSLYQLIEATGWEAGGANKGPLFSGFNDPAPRANYQQTYRYDPGGNLLELTHVGPQSHGRLLTAAKHSNRCLPEHNGQPPTEADIAAAFDANGDLLNLQPGQALSWDLRNQLKEVRPVERDSGLDDREWYVYGGDGMRRRKIRSTQTNARTLNAEVRYLPGLEIRTHSGTDEELHVIVAQAGRSGVRVLHWETEPPKGIANNQFRYSVADHLGSCTLELDSEGGVISQERFHPFGSTAWFAGRGDVEVSYKTVRYSGKEQDATGLYYYGFRYYVAWWQRWLNPDPAGYVNGGNLYMFVGNGPVAHKDIQGLTGIDINHLSESQRQIIGVDGPQLNPSWMMYMSNYDAVRSRNIVRTVDETTYGSLEHARLVNLTTKALLPYGADNQRLDLWRSPIDNRAGLEWIRSSPADRYMDNLLEIGIGNCGEHADISFNLLASAETKQPVFRVRAEGFDHGFVVIGDKRQLSSSKLVIVDSWPTFPVAHTAKAGAFKIGDVIRDAPASADPQYEVSDRTLIRNTRYDFPEVPFDGGDSIARFRSIDSIPTAFMQWFSVKDSRRGIDYKGARGKGNFNRLPEAYVMDRLHRYSNYLEVSRRTPLFSR